MADVTAQAEPRWSPRRLVVSALALALCAATFYTSGFGVFDEIIQRSMTVGISALLVILAVPLVNLHKPRSAAVRGLLWGIDGLLIFSISLAIYWFLGVYGELESGLYIFTPLDQMIGAGAIVVLLELSRRLFGLPLFIMAILSIAYCLLGSHLPWIFTHAGFGTEQTLRTLWYSFDGVFGTPVMVVLSLIFIYIIFGVVLEGTGGTGILLKIAYSVTGAWRGGPGHAAVIASALFGTISGSAAANAVGTGVFTIPMMRRAGFPKTIAGAIETCSSTGGQIMPPVMGAVAFMMSNVTGIPYLTICAAALMPSLFYYGSLLCAVYVEAVRYGVPTVPRAERVRLNRGDLRPALTFLVPLAAVVALLGAGFSAALAGFWATIAAVFVGLLNPDFRRRPQQLVGILIRAGTSGGQLMVAVAVIGIIIGTMNLTGLGLRFSALILSFSGDSLLVALLLMMLGCLVLGMGMPTVPAYLIIVLTMGPAMAKLGVSLLLTHMFVLYFGCMSAITPPVALAAYAAAPIAEADPMRTGFVAMRLAFVGFIIPYLMVYNPSLSLVEGFDWVEFLWIVLRLSLAIWLITTGFSGYDRLALPWWRRALRVGIGFAALVPITGIEILFTGLGCLLLALYHLPLRQRRALSTPN